MADAGAIAGIIQGATNSTIDIANFGLQVGNYQRQQDWYNQALGREDTAVQRRAADLKAAGLSKTLAAGAPASTMAPIRLDAPQMASQKGAETAAQLMQQARTIEQTKAQTALVNLQLAKTAQETQEAKARTAAVDADTTIKLYDYGIAKRLGVGANQSSPVGKVAKDVSGVLHSAVEVIKERLPDIKSVLNRKANPVETKTEVHKGTQFDKWRAKNKKGSGGER